MANSSRTTPRKKKKRNKEYLERKAVNQISKRLKMKPKSDRNRRSAEDIEKRRNNDLRRKTESLERRKNRDKRRSVEALERRDNNDRRRTETALEERKNNDKRRTVTALEERKNNDKRRTVKALEERKNRDKRRTETALERRQNNDKRRTETALERRQNNDQRRSAEGLAANREKLSERNEEDRIDIDYQSELYEKAIRRGATSICQCCDCLFFLEGTQTVDKDKIHRLWRNDFDKIYCVPDENQNIRFCITCARDIKQRKVPKLCLSNGYQFPERNPILIELTNLEERLVAIRLPFMQIRELKVGKQFKIRGNVVNVPINIEKTIDILPRTFDKTDTVQMKLKRMKRFEHSYINEFIRPAVVYEATEYLIVQPLYQREGIKLNDNWKQLYKESEEKFIVEETDKKEEELTDDIAPEDKWDETIGDDPINPNKDETLLKEGIVFAPGEGETPISLLYDKSAEELSFPKIFCGRERDITTKHSYSDICRSELRRADRRCCNTTNIFFKYRFKEMDQQRSAIYTFLRKGYTRDGQFNVKQAIDDNVITHMVNEDQAYKVLVGDRSSPAYWHSRLKQLMAMIRQIGIPTLFLTLSAAETHWSELLVILVKVLRNETVTKEQVMTYSFEKKSDLIREDPVTTARYFDHRIRQLFKIIRAPCGPFRPFDVEDTYIRVEFQSRGSPHIHCLIWLKGAPIYDSKDNASIKKCEEFIDQYISCSVGSMNGLERFQYHKHSQTCKKNTIDSVVCRFGIPQFPMGKTSILEPLHRDDLTKEEYKTFDHIMERILTQMKYIDECVKRNDDSVTNITFQQFIDNCDVTEETYIRVIRNGLKRPKVFLKRSPNQIRTNAYNPLILKLHRANMDLQYVLDPYSCVHYILNYINKSDRGMSTILKQVVNECKEGNLDHKQRLYRICSKFINCSEVSVQEAVYILLGMQLSRASRETIFINTGDRESRTRILKMKSELKKLDPESTDIFSDGLLEYYVNRPDELESCCLADFAADFTTRKAAKEVNETCEDSPENVPEQVDIKSKGRCLKNGLGVLIPRKRPRVIRYRRYQLKKEPLHYYREKVMLYLPWRDEDIDILQKDVQQIYNQREKEIFNIEKKYVFDAQLDLDQLEEQVETDMRDYNQTLKEDMMAEEYQMYGLKEFETDLEVELREKSNNESNSGTFLSPTMLSDDSYLQILISLNEKQRIFLLGLMNKVKTSNEPFHYFVTGPAGSGKSVLIKSVYQSLCRWYNRAGGNPDEMKVMLVGPTGKSAFNIRGTTIHSALHMPCTNNTDFIKALRPDLLNTLRAKLWHLKVIICDEISMVGNVMLSRIDSRLKEIFRSTEVFGGISLLFVGDFNQLPPVFEGLIFKPPDKLPYGAIAGDILWSKVKFYKLDQIMRQKNDLIFAQALNRAAIGQFTDADKEMFISRLFPEDSPHIPVHAVRLFRRNKDVNDYNSLVLENTVGELFENKAFDYTALNIPREVGKQAISVINHLPTNKTYNLPLLLMLKVGVQYMISTNIDIKDGLVNGTSGQLCAIDSNSNRKVSRLWFDFGETEIGNIARTKLHRPVFTDDGRPLTPINKVTRDITPKIGNRFIIVSREQFPVVISEAITIHKSQGQTYDKVVIDMSLKLQLSYFYTSISRAKTLNGLFLVGEGIIFPQERSVDNPVHRELMRLESTPLHFDLKFLREIKSNNHTAIYFHNLPYLRKHSQDISCDVNLLECDILAFVETRSNNVIIDGFDLRHSLEFDNQRPFGIALYTRSSIDSFLTAFTHYELYDQKSHFEYIRSDFGFFLIFVFYVSPSYPKKEFLTKIEQIIAKYLSRNIFIAGDWNIQYDSPLGKHFALMMRRLGLTQYPNICQPSTNHNTTIDYAFTSLSIDDAFYYESLVSDHKPLISLLRVHSE